MATSTSLLTFLLISSLSTSFSSEPKEGVPKLGSLSIFFDYGDTELSLPGVKVDQGPTQSFLEKAGIETNFVNNIASGASAEEYKSLIKKSIKEEVAKGAGQGFNFNYSGHGVRLPQGEWAFILPSMTSLKGEDFNACVNWANSTSPSAEPPPFCLEHVFTMSEFTEVSGKETPIFGLIDACHAGAIFGSGMKNFNFLTSADPFSKAPDKCENSPYGTIATYLSLVEKDSKLKCSLDVDKDNKITFYELGQGFYKIKKSSSKIGEDGKALDDVTSGLSSSLKQSDALVGGTENTVAKNTVMVTLEEKECAGENLKEAAALAAETLSNLNGAEKEMKIAFEDSESPNIPDKKEFPADLQTNETPTGNDYSIDQ